MIDALDRYLADKGVGKAMHDLLAAACALDERVCDFVEVEIYREKGEWGARATEGTNTRISVGFHEERFLDVLAR
jgi:pyrimidine-specific ribonucleoside hydrolase